MRKRYYVGWYLKGGHGVYHEQGYNDQAERDRLAANLERDRKSGGDVRSIRVYETERPARKAAPQIDAIAGMTPLGIRPPRQTWIEGAEPLSDKERAEGGLAKPLKAEKPQRDPDDGLFDVAGRGQKELF